MNSLMVYSESDEGKFQSLIIKLGDNEYLQVWLDEDGQVQHERKNLVDE